ITLIAPSHGPIHHQPEKILEAYKEWVGPETKNEAVVVFVSMHDSVAKMVNRLVERLSLAGINVQLFNLTVTDLGQLAISLVEATTLIVACPTVLGNTHPVAMSAASLIRALRPKIRFFGVMTSYLWGGQAEETLIKTLEPLQAELLPLVKVRGCPQEGDLKEIDSLADRIGEKHRQAGLL
ncbi:MAG: FprA family A-type flavoprotein, partial [Candidatus Omnitrophica bacterium]|nr:FprA family A-type flavoprotein [Candidatus Omnitrophota bacterium]